MEAMKSDKKKVNSKEKNSKTSLLCEYNSCGTVVRCVKRKSNFSDFAPYLFLLNNAID